MDGRLSSTAMWVCTIVMAMAGCGKKKSTSMCENYVGKMRACGLLTQGDFNCHYLRDDPVTRCEVDCVDAASCNDVELDVCQGMSPSLDQCFQQCREDHGFHCVTGGEIVLQLYVCDGLDDCTDSSDEQGCTHVEYFQCADGSSEVPAVMACDAWMDCPDGSDEQDCAFPDLLVCPDGSGTFSIDNWCDANTDCTDGWDEEGCAEFLCNQP